MRDGFGTRLRKRREQQKMSLAAIAEQTKIKASLLEGLERDDVSQWPGGIFRRSFVRAYAQALDLDPDATLREFLAIHPDPIEDIEAVAALASSSPNAKVGKRPPMRLRYLIDAGARALARVLSSSADAAGAAEVDGAQDRRQPLTEVEKAP